MQKTIEQGHAEAQAYFNKQRVLSFALTDKCNIRCRICSRSCEAEENFTPESVWKKCCDDLAFKDYAICIAGGEPTLYVDRTLEVARYAKKKALYVILQTNGWWGRNDRVIEALLSPGAIDVVNISTDKYHQEFLPRAVIVRLAERARAKGAIVLYETIVDTMDEIVDYEPLNGDVMTRYQILKRGAGRSKNIELKQIDPFMMRSGLCISQIGDAFETCPKCFNEYRQLPIIGNVLTENVVALFKKDCSYRGPECEGCVLL